MCVCVSALQACQFQGIAVLQGFVLLLLETRRRAGILFTGHRDKMLGMWGLAQLHVSGRLTSNTMLLS